VLNKIISFAKKEGYDIKDASFSPITGGDGNIEFLLHLFWEGSKEDGDLLLSKTVDEIVGEAHAQFKKE
ncbi:TlyA family rRNA (cytidine-2'-O)-methyltransferase, partial [Peribacillus sp. NPDC060186]